MPCRSAVSRFEPRPALPPSAPCVVSVNAQPRVGRQRLARTDKQSAHRDVRRHARVFVPLSRSNSSTSRQTGSEYNTGGRAATCLARRLSMFDRPWRLRCSQSFFVRLQTALPPGVYPYHLVCPTLPAPWVFSGKRPLQKGNSLPSFATAAWSQPDITWNDNPSPSPAPSPSPMLA